MTQLPLVPPEAVEAAALGVWCPKMCTFACPVHAATGREDAVPWSFHVALLGVAADERPDTPERLVACTGCLACQQPCTFDQDVPAQVRAARAVSRPSSPAADEVVEHLRAGRRPDGSPGTPTTGSVAGTTVVHAGCHDTPEVVAAATRLLEAAGHDVTVVGDGCCGRLAEDLGATDVARERMAHRANELVDAARVVLLDPHCGPALAGLRTIDLWTVLADADLAFDGTGDPMAVTYHDPCLLARPDGVVDPPRRLLAAAGVQVVEPEFQGLETACTGAGMGLPLLDPAAADATAHRRAGHLAATGADTVTACSRAADRLRAVGRPTTDLVVVLARRLPSSPEAP